MAVDFYRMVGAEIAEIRRARELTQEQLAEAAGLSAAYLSRIEAGARRATLEVLREIATALDVKVAVLVAEEPRAIPPVPVAVVRSRRQRELLRVSGLLSPRDLRLLLDFASLLGSRRGS